MNGVIELDFTGQHVVVFGGTSGINLGIAQAFHARGASVFVVSRSFENVERAVCQIDASRVRVDGYSADVRDINAVGEAFDVAVKRFGSVDVVVSGAAGNFLCEVNSMSINGFRAVVDIDLVGTFNVARQAFPHMRQGESSLINITAPQAAIPMRYQAHAGAAKAGVNQLTQILALEWGSAGIRVNAISPGPIGGTEGVRRLMGEGEAACAAMEAAVPLGRLGQPADIANLALFLASPHGSFISGAIIPCDGGGAIYGVKTLIEQEGDGIRETANAGT
jgi:NAD(P)-dependent dehydrogenase (short-subunit alcohol dehydrogenase family)